MCKDKSMKSFYRIFLTTLFIFIYSVDGFTQSYNITQNITLMIEMRKYFFLDRN